MCRYGPPYSHPPTTVEQNKSLESRECNLQSLCNTNVFIIPSSALRPPLVYGSMAFNLPEEDHSVRHVLKYGFRDFFFVKL